MIEFSIVDWAAWAPGLSERSQWLGWADAPYPPVGEDTPALAEIPAMQRRRIERLGIVVNAADAETGRLHGRGTGRLTAADHEQVGLDRCRAQQRAEQGQQEQESQFHGGGTSPAFACATSSGTRLRMKVFTSSRAVTSANKSS